jgi:hypothetical protein
MYVYSIIISSERKACQEKKRLKLEGMFEIHSLGTLIFHCYTFVQHRSLL